MTLHAHVLFDALRRDFILVRVGQLKPVAGKKQSLTAAACKCSSYLFRIFWSPDYFAVTDALPKTTFCPMIDQKHRCHFVLQQLNLHPRMGWGVFYSFKQVFYGVQLFVRRSGALS